MTKLTPAERAILINQFKILGEIEQNPKAYQNTIRVLSSGYELEYDDHIDGLGEPLPEEDCKFVNDIMYLYYLMKLANNRDAVADPGGEREPDGRLRLEKMEPKFPGFDGNGQPKLYGYANFLVHHDDKFIEHKHSLNSHGSTPNYAEMLDTWRKWGRPTELTDKQVDELISAGRW